MTRSVAEVGGGELSARDIPRLYSNNDRVFEEVISLHVSKMIKEYEENEEALFVNHRIEHRPRIETQIDSDPTLWGHSFTRRRGDLDFDRVTAFRMNQAAFCFPKSAPGFCGS